MGTASHTSSLPATHRERHHTTTHKEREVNREKKKRKKCKAEFVTEKQRNRQSHTHYWELKKKKVKGDTNETYQGDVQQPRRTSKEKCLVDEESRDSSFLFVF